MGMIGNFVSKVKNALGIVDSQVPQGNRPVTVVADKLGLEAAGATKGMPARSPGRPSRRKFLLEHPGTIGVVAPGGRYLTPMAIRMKRLTGMRPAAIQQTYGRAAAIWASGRPWMMSRPPLRRAAVSLA